MFDLDISKMTNHSTFCGGEEYRRTFQIENKTVKEVLEEIRETLKDSDAFFLDAGIDGKWGNHKTKSCGCWAIYINNNKYLSTWCERKDYQEYHHELDDKIVSEVRVSGGWYCNFDYSIYTKG